MAKSKSFENEIMAGIEFGKRENSEQHEIVQDNDYYTVLGDEKTEKVIIDRSKPLTIMDVFEEDNGIKPVQKLMSLYEHIVLSTSICS